jgi:hypothetical protein
MPDLIRHPGGFENTGCARPLRSLRLPSVARLEFIPMKIGAGMTTFLKGCTYIEFENILTSEGP